MVTMQVELADTARKVERGLAGRQQLAADTGMLFFMGRAKDWAFWMQETSISLDIIFITPDLRVAGIVHGAAPGTSIKHRIGAMSLYVLEVNAGWAAGHGITKGATVQFENVRL